MLKTDPNYYIQNNNIYTKDNVTTILNIFVEHFKKSKLPIFIDDGVFSYCIANVTGSTTIDSNVQSFTEDSDPLFTVIILIHKCLVEKYTKKIFIGLLILFG